MTEAWDRYQAMLNHIPQRPAKITARILQERLSAEGHDIHIRSIERDLHKLSQKHGLISDGARPAGWSWMEKQRRVSFPQMDLTTAFTYELMHRYLTPMLPPAMLKGMQPEFHQARHALAQQATSPVSRWSKRVAVLPFWQQLIPPSVPSDVSETVYEALLKGHRFEAQYRARNSDAAKPYVFNPLGLVYRDGVLYVVATAWDYTDVRHYALQRMSRAKLFEVEATPIEGFDFERYVREERSFDYPTGDSIQLEILAAPTLARHLEESRLSQDQKVTPVRGDERSRVTATVANTDKLFWWLCGLGAGVEVRKPASLRRRMSENSVTLSAYYG